MRVAYIAPIILLSLASSLPLQVVRRDKALVKQDDTHLPIPSPGTIIPNVDALFPSNPNIPGTFSPATPDPQPLGPIRAPKIPDIVPSNGDTSPDQGPGGVVTPGPATLPLHPLGLGQPRP
ncbi:hypothetical protein DL96DRAFT_1706767 [Flagelloscypha sp. PMI_526]|nr:hypothetical protein DL96DRAFT_1706767 [Flagelloscypha sp. PMI_526]